MQGTGDEPCERLNSWIRAVRSDGSGDQSMLGDKARLLCCCNSPITQWCMTDNGRWTHKVVGQALDLGELKHVTLTCSVGGHSGERGAGRGGGGVTAVLHDGHAKGGFYC